MKKKIKFIIPIVFISLFNFSCTNIQDCSFDTMWGETSADNVVASSTPRRYMGSDDKYDYYKLLRGAFRSAKLYRCPTQPKRFYPHIYSFRGWDRHHQYILNQYRGRFVVTPEKEWDKLHRYWIAELRPHLVRVYVKESKKKQGRKIAQKIATEFGLHVLNDWTIKHWGQDRLRIIHYDGRSEVETEIAGQWARHEKTLDPDWVTEPVYKFGLIISDVRFGK